MRRHNHTRPAGKAGMALLAAALLALVAPLWALGANPGNPAEVDADAEVRVLMPIEIAEVTPLYFGKIIAPSSGSQDFVMDATGMVTPGAGDGQTVGDLATLGIYTVTYTGNENVTNGVSSPPVASCDSGISVSLFRATVSTDSASGQNIWNTYGTLTVDSGAPTGLLSCSYTLSAEYL